jgi:hypothetical protein
MEFGSGKAACDELSRAEVGKSRQRAKSKVHSERKDDRGQMTDDRGRKTEGRDLKSEGGRRPPARRGNRGLRPGGKSEKAKHIGLYQMIKFLYLN